MTRFFPRRRHTPVVGETPHVPTASQHRAGHSAGLHPEDMPYLTTGGFTHPMPTTSLAPPPQTPLRLPAPVDLSVSDDPPTEVSVGRRQTRPVALSLPTPPPPSSVPLSLSNTPQVYTIGYSQPCARLVIDTLVWQEGWLLVDMRRTPTSTWTDWTGRALVQRYGPAYQHVPVSGTCPVADSAVPPVLVDAPAGLWPLLHLLETGRRCLLLCACKDYHTCQRAEVAALLHETGVAVRHLINQTLPPEQMRMGYLKTSGLAVSVLLTAGQMRAAATESLVSLTRTHTVATNMAHTTALTVQVSVTAWPATVPPSSRRTPPSQGGDR